MSWRCKNKAMTPSQPQRKGVKAPVTQALSSDWFGLPPASQSPALLAEDERGWAGQEGGVPTRISTELLLPWHPLGLWTSQILLMTKHSHSGGRGGSQTYCCSGLTASGQWISIRPVILQPCLRKTLPRDAVPNPHSGPWHTHNTQLWEAPENIQIWAPCGCFQGPVIISRTHQWLHKTHRPPSTLCVCGLYSGSYSTAPCMVENQTDKRLSSHCFPICLPKTLLCLGTASIPGTPPPLCSRGGQLHGSPGQAVRSLRVLIGFNDPDQPELGPPPTCPAHELHLSWGLGLWSLLQLRWRYACPQLHHSPACACPWTLLIQSLTCH